MGKQESKEFEEFKEGRRKISRTDAKAQRFGDGRHEIAY
jgi:hypothetical protein